MNAANLRYGGLGRATVVLSANTNVSQRNVASIFSVEELRVSPSIFTPHPHTWHSFAANHDGTVRVSVRRKLHFTARRWNFPLLWTTWC